MNMLHAWINGIGAVPQLDFRKQLAQEMINNKLNDEGGRTRSQRLSENSPERIHCVQTVPIYCGRWLGNK